MRLCDSEVVYYIIGKTFSFSWDLLKFYAQGRNNSEESKHISHDRENFRNARAVVCSVAGVSANENCSRGDKRMSLETGKTE